VLSHRRAASCCLLAALAVLLGPVAARAATTSADSIPMVSGPLTFDHALTLSGQYHLTLRAANLRATAAEARIRDAGRRPNPTLAATEENFGGAIGSEHLESTIELAQTLELGGDRGARKAVATGEYRLAAADAGVLRREALVLTAERFIRAWSLQVRLARLREGEELTMQAIQAATQRHQAGASPLLERTRIESQALSQAVDRKRTESELAMARRELAISWGDGRASFDSLVADPTPSRSELSYEAIHHPELERAHASEALAEARVKAAQAARIPDITLSGGVRYLQEAHGQGFLAAVELPLPIWGNGGGNLSAAKREYEATVAEKRATAQRIDVEIANAVEGLRSASAAYDTLRLRVRPAQRQILGELLRMYRSGRLSYLDLIAEQRGLLNTDIALVDAQADVWRSRVLLELLVGERWHGGTDQ
jgi:cobalt-zinc-cadmium efflux system outer membrane protein